jgi:hypothetical protein
MVDGTTIPKDKKLCECGCGELIFTHNRNGILRFKKGHNRRGIAGPRGPDNGNWKGGIRKSSHGYIMVLKPGHPKATKEGYVYQHILVLEEKLGRPLLPNEDTHHINGIKTDNSPENLINLKHGEHTTLTNTIDMSSRVCRYCGGRKTNHRNWYENGTQCAYCYNKSKKHVTVATKLI